MNCDLAEANFEGRRARAASPLPEETRSRIVQSLIADAVYFHPSLHPDLRALANLSYLDVLRIGIDIGQQRGRDSVLPNMLRAISAIEHQLPVDDGNA